MKKRIFTVILIFVFSCIMLFSGYQIYKIFSEYESGESAYEELEEYVSTPSRMEKPVVSQNPSESEQSLPEVDFDGLSSANPDIVGWIYSEGTPINYPVVQTVDNYYYLKHLFNGEYNSAGSIYLDSRNLSDFSDQHSIIYGHHMKNDTMFSSLTGYKKQEYYEGTQESISDDTGK